MLFLSRIPPVFFNFAPQWPVLSDSPRPLTGEGWQILLQQLKMSANPALHISAEGCCHPYIANSALRNICL